MKQRTNIFLLMFFLILLLSLTQGVWASTTIAAANAPAPGSGNTYFHKFFVEGGWLVKLILIPLSVITISLIVQNFLLIRPAKLAPTNLRSKIGRSGPGTGGVTLPNAAELETSMLGRILITLQNTLSDDPAAVENAMVESLERETAFLMRKIEWLHIIGNVAPMIGLFGTVWGMIEAFNAIVQAGGQPTLGQLAGGISTVLVATWWGLASAIPALAAFGILRNRVEIATADIASLLENLIARQAGETAPGKTLSTTNQLSPAK